MDFLHSTWFWLIVIVAPLFTIINTLARLSRQAPPPDLPPGVKPGFKPLDRPPKKPQQPD